MPERRTANGALGRRGDDGWWELRLRVRFSEVDSYGVVWHGRYLAWFEEARNDLARGYGFTPSMLAKQGYQLPVRDLSMTFKSPAGLDDEVLVGIRFQPTETAVIDFEYRVREAEEGRLMVNGRTRQVVTRADNELLLTYPPPIRDALQRLRQDQSVPGETDGR
jgi:acyl-CoA thioester hydrolase